MWTSKCKQSSQAYGHCERAVGFRGGLLCTNNAIMCVPRLGRCGEHFLCVLFCVGLAAFDRYDLIHPLGESV